jgi:glycine dehydrogenase subunit 2
MPKTIYQKSRKGSPGYRFASEPLAQSNDVPVEYLRDGPVGLPEVSEPEVVRHYIELSTLNHHVDKDLFPLGSCTMKYNPKVNEDVAMMRGFWGLHPEQDAEDVQGALAVMHELENSLAAIAGMDAVSTSTTVARRAPLCSGPTRRTARIRRARRWRVSKRNSSSPVPTGAWT